MYFSFKNVIVLNLNVLVFFAEKLYLQKGDGHLPVKKSLTPPSGGIIYDRPVCPGQSDIGLAKRSPASYVSITLKRMGQIFNKPQAILQLNMIHFNTSNSCIEQARAKSNISLLLCLCLTWL